MFWELLKSENVYARLVLGKVVASVLSRSNSDASRNNLRSCFYESTIKVLTTNEIDRACEVKLESTKVNLESIKVNFSEFDRQNSSFASSRLVGYILHAYKHFLCTAYLRILTCERISYSTSLQIR